MEELISNKIQLGLTAPTMSSIAPTQGEPGTKVVIKGDNFGPYNSSSAVYIGVSQLTIKKWTNTEVEALIPNDAITAKIFIQNSNGRSPGIKFVIPGMSAPKLISLDPVSGTSGTEVTITMENGNVKTSESKAYIGGKELIVDAWTDTVLNVRVPYGAESANIYVQNKFGRSNGLAFEVEKFVEPSPAIEYFLPVTANVGSEVTVYGANFGNIQGRVTINGSFDLNIKSWANEAIKVIIPSGASTGNLYVHIGLTVLRTAILTIGSESAEASTNSTPYIKNIRPGYGVLGEKIYVDGVNFKSGTTMFIDSVSIPLISEECSIYTLVGVMPSGATSGYLYLECNGVQSNNKYVRVHQGRPEVSYVFPAKAKIGEYIHIYGKNFMSPRFANDCAVKFGSGRYATLDGLNVTKWSDNEIQFTLPDSIDYSAGYIKIKVFELESEKYSKITEGASTAPTSSISSGEIRNAKGQMVSHSAADVPPLAGVHKFSKETENFDTERLDGKLLSDIISYVDSAADPTVKKSITVAKIEPDKLGNITFKGLGLITVISKKSENTVLVKGLTQEDLVIDLTQASTAGSFCETFGHCKSQFSSTSTDAEKSFIKDIVEGPGITKDRLSLDGDLVINGETVNQQVLVLKPTYGNTTYNIPRGDHSHEWKDGTYYLAADDDRMFIDGSDLDSIIFGGE